jgi:hypothetical protein
MVPYLYRRINDKLELNTDNEKFLPTNDVDHFDHISMVKESHRATQLQRHRKVQTYLVTERGTKIFVTALLTSPGMRPALILLLGM